MASLSPQAAKQRVGQYQPGSLAAQGASHAGGVRRRDEDPAQFRGRMDDLKAASGQPSQTYGSQNFRAPAGVTPPMQTRQDRVIASRMDGTFDAKRNTFNAGNTNVQMDESGNIAPRAISPVSQTPAQPSPSLPVSPPPVSQSPAQTPPPSVVNNSPIGPVTGNGNPLGPIGGKPLAGTPAQNSPIGATAPADPAKGLFNQPRAVTPVTPPVTPQVTPQSVTPRAPVTPPHVTPPAPSAVPYAAKPSGANFGLARAVPPRSPKPATMPQPLPVKPQSPIAASPKPPTRQHGPIGSAIKSAVVGVGSWFQNYAKEQRALNNPKPRAVMPPSSALGH